MPLDPVLIVLAAGNSSRMGFPKGLIEIEPGETFLRRALGRFAESGGRRAIVLLGSHADIYQANRSEWDVDGIDVSIAINPEPSRGQFSSLRIAASMLAIGESAFVLPIDVPAPSARVWRGLAALPTFDAAIPSFKGRGGHPVWLSPGFCMRIVNAEDGTRLDQMIRELPTQTRRNVEFNEPSLILNVNTPRDLSRASLSP